MASPLVDESLHLPIEIFIMALPATSITVNDGANTPVPQSFSLTDRTGLTTLLRNTAASLVRGAQTIKHRVVLGGNRRQANSVTIETVAPVEGTVDGQITVVRTSRAQTVFYFSPDAPEAERQALYGLHANLLAHADVKEASKKLVSLG